MLWCRLFLALQLFAAVSVTPIFSQRTFMPPDAVTLDEVYISQRDTITVGRDTALVIKNILVRSKDTLIALRRELTVGKKKAFAYYIDTIVTTRDTILTSVDTILGVTKVVLNKIETFSKKRNLLSRLLRNVLVFDNQPVPIDTSIRQAKPLENTQDRYAQYTDKIIGNIDIQVINVLGYSIDNLNKRPRSLLEKAGNSVHIKTYKNIIRNKLLFEKGERVNTLKISESERLLRAVDYIYDARISLVPHTDSDTVDVVVLSQDIWSITGGGSFDLPSKATSISLRDNNFFGLGQQIENSFRFQNTLPSGYNYVGIYNVNNVYRTQAGANIFYRYQNGEKRYGIGINREFLSPAIHLAGGINYDRNELYTINPVDSLRHKLGYNQQDLWIGYSGAVNKESATQGNRIIVSGRLIRTDFFERPGYWNTAGFKSNYLHLASIGYLNRTFFRDNYIFRLGRTEDVPEGKLVSITAGWQNGESTRRMYMGAKSTWSKYKKSLGYFYLSTGIGAFKSINDWEEGAYYGTFLYYSPLAQFSTWRYRGFISIRASHAINQPGSVLTNVNRENGLRGLNSGLLYGTDKLVMNLENDIFPNFNFIGFRFGIIVFADFAWVSNREKLIDRSNFYQGYGIGLRIKNENLIFSMMQFFIGYYPGAARVKQDAFQFFERTKYFYNYNEFEFSRPTQVQLN